MYKNIIIDVVESICTISIDREDKLNALNIATLAEIKLAIEDGNQDKDIYGFVLTGKGDKAFAAGADISEFANFSVAEATKMSADGHAVMNTIENSAKPVVAAVNGFALGGGCELAMACHIRIASANAKFGQPEVNLGVPPGYGATQRLVQLVGKGKALEMLMTADAIDAETALRLGLANQVVELEDLLATCHKLVTKISRKSPMAIKNVIDCVNDHFVEGKDGFKSEIKAFGEAFGTSEFKEGTDAFLNKRRASFRGESQA